MQAVPPSHPIQHCVRRVDDVTALISVSGSAQAMQAFNDVLKRYPKWKQEGEGSGAAGDRLIVLRGLGSLPYREIGGLFFEAQRLGLAIVFTPSAPLCDDKTG